MKLIGTINCEMDEDKWSALIEKHDELTPVDKITVVDPFTQETETIGFAGECVSVVIDAADVGAMRCCKKGIGIDVFGDSAAMQRLIDLLVKECSGDFDKID